MKKLILLLLLATVCLLSTGCTLNETPAQRHRRMGQINDLQMRMLVEDWDYLWLYERNTQTSQFHPWVGI